jgi:hypothetical protein
MCAEDHRPADRGGTRFGMYRLNRCHMLCLDGSPAEVKVGCYRLPGEFLGGDFETHHNAQEIHRVVICNECFFNNSSW